MIDVEITSAITSIFDPMTQTFVPIGSSINMDAGVEYNFDVSFTANIITSWSDGSGMLDISSNIDGILYSSSANLVGGNVSVNFNYTFSTEGNRVLTTNWTSNFPATVEDNIDGEYTAIIAEAPCVKGDTQVKTLDGFKSIKNINANDKVLKYTGEYINVKFNLKFKPMAKFVKITKNAFGDNKPSKDLYIRRGHPLLIGNVEINCEDLVNNEDIEFVNIDKPDNVYSLCTDDRTYVMMNNVPVCTWVESEWDTYCNTVPHVTYIKQ